MNESIPVTIIRIIAERPSIVPEGESEHFVVFNAPRPLYGHHECRGDFLHGVFYVAVDLRKENARAFVKSNNELDGWVVRYIDQETAVETARNWYQDNRPQLLEKWEPNDPTLLGFLETYFHNHLSKIDGELF